MNRSKLSICVVFLVVIGPIAAVPARAEAVAAPALSATAIPTTAVIRGSAPAAARSGTANDSSPIVLRGSPPLAAQPLAAEYACPAGYDSDLRRGCVMPDYVYEPNGYRYWPDYGFDGFSRAVGATPSVTLSRLRSGEDWCSALVAASPMASVRDLPMPASLTGSRHRPPHIILRTE